MMRRKLCASVTGLLIAAAAAQGQTKKRVAVLDFEYGTVQSAVAGIFGTNVDVGKGIADLLVERLVKDAVYSVIERKALQKVLAEQNLANSDRADSSTAAKIGRILGVDAIILGSITQFGRDDKDVGVAGSAISGALGRYGLGRVGKKDSKAVVGITARLIDTTTAEILAAVTGRGESRRSGVSLLGSGGGSGSIGAAAADLTSSNFGQTILGEATAEAVVSIASQLEANAGALPQRKVAIEGLVADVSGATLVLNVGSKAGVRVGDRLEVSRKQREIRDPASGKVIRTIEDKLGEVVITEVDELSAVGKYTGEPAKVGDQVKNAP